VKVLALIAIVLIVFTSCSRDSLDRRMEEADALVGIGNHEAARDIYFDVAASCPKYKRCAEALLRVGEIEANVKGHPENALEAYERVIEFYPLQEAGRIARERRAALFERKGDYLGAAGEYAQLLQYFPKNKNAAYDLLRLGESYVALGSYKQARNELQGLIDSNSVSEDIKAEAGFAYAESYFLEGRLGLAEKAYQRLVNEFPKSNLVSEARMKIATCREERGQMGDAARSMEAAKKGFPNEKIIDERLKSMEKRGVAKPSAVVEDQKEAKAEAEKTHEEYDEQHNIKSKKDDKKEAEK
jgi:TolA-binding protein